MRRSTGIAALALAMFIIGVITQLITGLTLTVVDGDATAAPLMAWAVYLRIGESR